jgi:hypothetical protein
MGLNPKNSPQHSTFTHIHLSMFSFIGMGNRILYVMRVRYISSHNWNHKITIYRVLLCFTNCGLQTTVVPQQSSDGFRRKGIAKIVPDTQGMKDTPTHVCAKTALVGWPSRESGRINYFYNFLYFSHYSLLKCFKSVHRKDTVTVIITTGIMFLLFTSVQFAIWSCHRLLKIKKKGLINWYRRTVKGKAVPLHAMEALGGRGIAPTHSRPRH